MPGFVDIHCHMLCGVDDGPREPAETIQMLEMAYAEGIRTICFTPHFSPYSEEIGNAEERFAQISAYASSHYPDLSLRLGNEIFYHADAVDNLRDGVCLSLGHSKYVLVEFSERTAYYDMDKRLSRLISVGYVPVLAHTERYVRLWRSLKYVKELHRKGVVIQCNASTVTGGAFPQHFFCRRLLRHQLVDVIATDCHDAKYRKPLMKACYHTLSSRYGEEYAYLLMTGNPTRILANKNLD